MNIPDTPAITGMISLATLLVSLHTNAAVSKLENRLKEWVDKHFVRKEVIRMMPRKSDLPPAA